MELGQEVSLHCVGTVLTGRDGVCLGQLGSSRNRRARLMPRSRETKGRAGSGHMGPHVAPQGLTQALRELRYVLGVVGRFGVKS